MTQFDTDILVAGGGPAGLASAIRARQHGLDVLLLEPKSSPIDKACGEGLMPAALDALEKLGVNPNNLEGIPFEGIRYSHTERPNQTAVGTFDSAAKGVRRIQLYRALKRRADELGVRFEHRRLDQFECTTEWVKTPTEKARWLIAADGLHSSVRRFLGLDSPDAAIARFGVRRHFEIEPWSRFVEVRWSERGEAYITPVGPKTVGVALLTDEGARFDHLMAAFPNLAGRLQSARPLTPARGAGPFRQKSLKVRYKRTLLVGDAAGYVDALTGEGVALAVQTAVAAVDSIASESADKYPERYDEITRSYRWITGLALQLTRSPKLQSAAIKALDRIPGLFDGLLGLLNQSKNLVPVDGQFPER